MKNIIVENLLRLKGFEENKLANLGLEHLAVFDHKDTGLRISIDIEEGWWMYVKPTGETLNQGTGDESLVDMLRDLRYPHHIPNYIEFPEGS